MKRRGKSYGSEELDFFYTGDLWGAIHQWHADLKDKKKKSKNLEVIRSILEKNPQRIFFTPQELRELLKPYQYRKLRKYWQEERRGLRIAIF